MRHRVAGRRLGRDSEHRLAMRRNMVASLFEHETISTTIEKAKEIKPFAEKLITLAKKGDLASRRRVIALLGDRSIVVEEDGDFVKKGSVISKLFSELGPRYLDRNGGYTRIIRLAMRRLGDNGQLVLLQLLGPDEKVEKKAKKAKKARKKIKDVAEEEPVEVVEEQPQETPDEQDQPEQTEEVAETAKDVQDESKQ